MDGHAVGHSPPPVDSNPPRTETRRIGTRQIASAALCGAALCISLVGAACSASGTQKADPITLLQQAKAKVDTTSALHFALTSTGGTHRGTTILGGSGDLTRPDAIEGSFTVSVDGLPVDVRVISQNGVFAAKLPFGTRYVRTDPAKFGLEDPAQLMNPQTGLTRLLLVAKDPRMGAQQRLSGELLDSVDATVAGTDIPVLPDVAPNRPVDLVALVNPVDDQLRQVRLTGPFTSAQSESTYVLTLTAYDEHVDITLPPVH
jgi:lipoprotein LprG